MKNIIAILIFLTISSSVLAQKDTTQQKKNSYLSFNLGFYQYGKGGGLTTGGNYTWEGSKYLNRVDVNFLGSGFTLGNTDPYFESWDIGYSRGKIISNRRFSFLYLGGVGVVVGNENVYSSIDKEYKKDFFINLTLKANVEFVFNPTKFINLGFKPYAIVFITKPPLIGLSLTMGLGKFDINRKSY